MDLTRLGKPQPSLPTGPTVGGVSMTGTGGGSRMVISVGIIMTAPGLTETLSVRTTSWTSALCVPGTGGTLQP